MSLTDGQPVSLIVNEIGEQVQDFRGDLDGKSLAAAQGEPQGFHDPV
jgi:hypothetical protein